MIQVSTGPLGVLKHRNFAWYLTAQLLTAFAVQVQSVAVGWQIYQQTGSLVNLGLVGLFQFLPFDGPARRCCSGI